MKSESYEFTKGMVVEVIDTFNGGARVVCVGTVERLTRTQAVVMNEHGNRANYWLKNNRVVGYVWPTVTQEIRPAADQTPLADRPKRNAPAAPAAPVLELPPAQAEAVRALLVEMMHIRGALLRAAHDARQAGVPPEIINLVDSTAWNSLYDISDTITTKTGIAVSEQKEVEGVG